jgi:glutaredoxin
MKKVILYTMKGCPWCQIMKDELKEAKVKYVERDIDDHKDEYDILVEATSNDYLPALMLITINKGESSDVKLMVPDRDFKEISEAVEKVKNYL